MFKFPSSTKVEQNFKMSELLKMVKADKSLKADAQNILSVQMTNAISEQTTGLHSSDEVNEIYVMKIMLNSEKVPIEFIKALDKTIRFQVLYEIYFDNKVRHLISLKIITDERIKILNTFESRWHAEKLRDLPVTTKLEDVFKVLVEVVSEYKFRQEENFVDYTKRLETIKKLSGEIEKQTRIMNAEKQPNIKMDINDRIKKMKKELQDLEG